MEFWDLILLALVFCPFAFFGARVPVDISGKVNKAGDTMTGDLHIQKTNPGVYLNATGGSPRFECQASGATRVRYMHNGSDALIRAYLGDVVFKDGALEMQDEDVVSKLAEIQLGQESLQIAGGVITKSAGKATVIEVESQSGVTDDLDTMNGGTLGEIAILTAKTGHTIDINDGAGNFTVFSADPIQLDGEETSLMVRYSAANTWVEVSFGG